MVSSYLHHLPTPSLTIFPSRMSFARAELVMLIPGSEFCIAI
jgi:hypothetical protein